MNSSAYRREKKTDADLNDITRAEDNGPPPRYCSCSECLISGTRIPRPKHHDCENISKRNALIPEAMRLADLRVVVTDDDELNSSRIAWMKHFSLAMDELAASLLRQKNGNA